MKNRDPRHLARELHGKMIGRDRDAVFLPTGGVFLTISLERLRDIRGGNATIETDEDFFDIYAEWHEAAHIGQLLTSPYLFTHTFGLTMLAREAFRRSQTTDSRLSMSDLSAEFSKLTAKFESPDGGYSVQNIVEAHAVGQGLRWALPDAPSEDLLEIANRLYRDNIPYVLILNETAQEFGSKAAFQLLPRLCFVALQHDGPGTMLSRYLQAVRESKLGIEACSWSPRRLLEWMNVDVRRVTRSLRERARTLTTLDGRPFGLADHWLFSLYDGHFEDFEGVESADERLDALVGDRGGITFEFFPPPFTVFSDGRGLRSAKSQAIDENAWIQLTLDLFEGLSSL